MNGASPSAHRSAFASAMVNVSSVIDVEHVAAPDVTFGVRDARLSLRVTQEFQSGFDRLEVLSGEQEGAAAIRHQASH